MDNRVRIDDNPYIFSVIMPVYNVSEFLEEALDSIVHQTIGFDKIQMILVDDGSTDGSGALCDRFRQRYPEQTTVIHKENGGQASARNAALPYAKGKYISMPDPDDLLDEDALEKACRFLDEHYETDMCCIPMVFFGKQTGPHTLNYKFCEGTRVIDLSLQENMANILLSVASSFFRANTAKAMLFDTNLYHMEDAKVILKVLMDNPRLGILSDTVYHYRKHGNSTTDNNVKRKLWYTNDLILFSKWALDTAKNRYEYVPWFIQYTVMYDLQWKFNQRKIPVGVLSIEEEEDYRKLLNSTASRIDDDVILAQKNLAPAFKAYILSHKYKKPPERVYDKKGTSSDGMPVCDCVLTYGESIVLDFSEVHSCLEFLSFHETEQSMTIEGYHVICGGFSDGELSPGLIVNNHVIMCEKVNRREKDLSLDGTVAWRMGFRAEIPLNINKLLIQPVLMTDGKLINRTSISYGQFFPLTRQYINMRAYRGRWMLKPLSEGLIITKRPVFIVRFFREALLLAEIWHKNLLGGRKAVFGRMLYHLVKPFKRKKLWIVSDRIMKADDNGEALFRYLMKHKPDNTHILFSISKKSPDAERMATIGPCVDAMSFRHKFLHLLCDVNISSQADNVTLNPFSGYSEALHDLLVHPQFVFLQHGITKDDISNWLNKYSSDIKGFVTAALPEQRSLIEGRDYHYSAEKIWLTGFPRFDRLYHNEGKKVVLMPTWRRYLMDSLDGKTSIWNPKDDFEDSDYYQFYTGLLNSNKLLNALEVRGYTLQFFPHPNLRLSGIQFRHDSRVEVLSTDISYRDIYATSNLVLTDYSSAVFDFAYLRKPIIYCQFDREEFFSGEHVYTKGYFDYERDGFGEVECDLESTIERIIEYVENDCKLKPMYQERIDQFFAFHDHDNCKRVVDRIMNLPENDF